jgi:predicted CopG family antitoxin
MQISLNIQDDVYQKLVNAGVDMQSKINDYLMSLANKKQFQEDKAYFNQALSDIESGKDQLLDQEEYDIEMNEFIKSL